MEACAFSMAGVRNSVRLLSILGAMSNVPYWPNPALWPTQAIVARTSWPNFRSRSVLISHTSRKRTLRGGSGSPWRPPFEWTRRENMRLSVRSSTAGLAPYSGRDVARAVTRRTAGFVASSSRVVKNSKPLSFSRVTINPSLRWKAIDNRLVL